MDEIRRCEYRLSVTMLILSPVWLAAAPAHCVIVFYLTHKTISTGMLLKPGLDCEYPCKPGICHYYPEVS